jgi:ribonuclease VapC
MIVDSSALIAVLKEEPEGEEILRELTRTLPIERLSAANYLKAAIVVDANRNPVLSRRFDDLIARTGAATNRPLSFP